MSVRATLDRAPGGATVPPRAYTRGAVMVVYGEAAEAAASRAYEALTSTNASLPIFIYRGGLPGLTNMQLSRLAKVTLLHWSPFDLTLYLDADTQPYQPLDAGFQILEAGFDLAIAPSTQQDSNALWHLSQADRAETVDAVGGVMPLQLQAGVFFVARRSTTKRLFAEWAHEWDRYQDQDQGALLRALYKAPVRIWLLGAPWNGGGVIGHHFGSVRGSQ